MLVSFEKLKDLRLQTSMVDGGFDPLHLGHIEYFKEAARLGLPVLCCIASDEYVRKKHKPLLTQQSRAGIIDAIRYIDFVCFNESTTADVLRQLRPRYYVKGKDWENRLPTAETKVCAEFGIEVVYLNTVLDSSSRILKDYLVQEG